jgi:rhamnogalacturonan endolyase
MITADDWIHGEHLNLKEARRMTTGIHQGEVEHKYDYSAMFSQTPAYGWSSTTKNIGVWIVQPSLEYIQAPPTRIDLTGHIDLKDSKPACPTLLMIWHSFHYGGLALCIDQNEDWNKVIGPFLIYCNQGPSPDAMWQDALARAATEKKAWPYSWAKMPGYASAEERGSVTGKLVVQDPQQPTANASHAWVGLALGPYSAVDQSGKPFTVEWETDGKHYEYWAQADAAGAFSIPNARPGNYVLYAFNDGILGDYSKANVTVEAGKSLDLGTLVWTPLRYGKQVWEIGIPNRSAEEFRHGNQPNVWGLYNLYPTEFPADVNYVVGKSDWSKDWNYAQPGRDDKGVWHGTTWKINFNMGPISPGKATLRLALCGTRDSEIDVVVNGHKVGSTGPMPSSGVMHRDGMRATEILRDIPFDTSNLVPGNNVIELTTHARAWVSGVLYDYLRLEINDSQN